MDELVAFTVKVKPHLLEAVDSAGKINGEGRAQFVRNALAEKIERMGIKLPPDAKLSNDRKGVGGRPTHRKRKPELTDGVASASEGSETANMGESGGVDAKVMAVARASLPIALAKIRAGRRRDEASAPTARKHAPI